GSAKGLEGVEVSSAGVFAGAGQPASDEAVEAAKALGADIAEHRSRPLTREMVTDADVIYTMTESHRHAVLAMAPEAATKTQRLDALRDVDDPFGGPAAAYEAAADQLRGAIESRLKELAP
ncbi:MAG: low molecular weight protein arginine phosphatase, partial [Planctomycetota bacterium]